MKRIAIILLAFVFPALAVAQKKYEYTPKVKNKVEISNFLGGVSIQNAPGNTIIIESDYDLKIPKRADGLKLLGSAEDNTQIGLNVTEENGVVSIQGTNKRVGNYNYTIKVPVGIDVSMDYGSPFAKGDIAVNSYNGSLELKTLSAAVKITDSSGPFTVNTISGDIEVVFNKINPDEPTSLASVSGAIDITVPSAEKATFEISTLTGNVYNNLDLKGLPKAEKDKRAEGLETVNKHGGNTYTLNGGGQKIFLKDVSGNIYIRKP